MKFCYFISHHADMLIKIKILAKNYSIWVCWESKKIIYMEDIYLIWLHKESKRLNNWYATEKYIIMTRYDEIITDNFLLESLNWIKTIFTIHCFLKQSLTQRIIILKYSTDTDREISWQIFDFYKCFWRVTYKIEKFHTCLIYFDVKFEPDC